MVKNLPCSAGDGALIPGQETNIPHATEELNLHTVTTEPPHWSLCATTRDCEATKDPTGRSQVNT